MLNRTIHLPAVRMIANLQDLNQNQHQHQNDDD